MMKKKAQIKESQGIDKSEIEAYLHLKQTEPKAFQLISDNNKVVGTFITSSSKDLKPVELAMEKGFKTKSVSFKSLPSKVNDVYKFSNEKGSIGGVWVPDSSGSGVETVGAIIPADWSTTKIVGGYSAKNVSKSSIPVPKADFIKSIRETMMEQAIDLACKSKILPKDIAVTASLAASVGFIVGGEGTISFEATWETEKLCQISS